MNAKLVILTGTKAGFELTIPESGVTLGRNQANDFAFGTTDDMVSGSHASIRYVGGRYVLRDEGSTNGTFVNNRRIQEQELRSGDQVEFGLGGPTARFERPAAAAAYPTAAQHAGGASGRPAGGTVTRLLSDARQAGGGSNTMVMKEFVRLAYRQSSRRARRMTLAVGAVAIVVTGSVWAKGELDRRAAEAEIRRARSEISSLVGRLQEGDARSEALRTEMANLRQQNLTMRADLADVEAENQRVRREIAEAEARANANRSIAQSVTEQYSGSVAYLSFGYGWHSADGQVLRQVVDDEGRAVLGITADGDTVPELRLGGRGPAFGGVDSSSCTGFLIDGEGWIVTNRHCAEPWLFDESYAALRAAFEGEGLTMGFIGGGPVVYFPDDPDGLPATVEAVSGQADVAVLRTSASVSRTPVPLAPAGSVPDVGDDLVLAGYPTGLQYIVEARLPASDRDAYVAAYRSGDDLRFLIDRGLLYPFVAVGTVNDLAAGVIVHDVNTYGGASGSPVLGASGSVVGVHHASNPFDIDRRTGAPRRGTDFTVKYAAEVGYVWDILPSGLRSRLEQR